MGILVALMIPSALRFVTARMASREAMAGLRCNHPSQDSAKRDDALTAPIPCFTFVDGAALRSRTIL